MTHPISQRVARLHERDAARARSEIWARIGQLVALDEGNAQAQDDLLRVLHVQRSLLDARTAILTDARPRAWDWPEAAWVQLVGQYGRWSERSTPRPWWRCLGSRNEMDTEIRRWARACSMPERELIARLEQALTQLDALDKEVDQARQTSEAAPRTIYHLEDSQAVERGWRAAPSLPDHWPGWLDSRLCLLVDNALLDPS